MIHVLLDIDVPPDSKLTMEDIKRYFIENYKEAEVEIDDENLVAWPVVVDGVSVTEG